MAAKSELHWAELPAKPISDAELARMWHGFTPSLAILLSRATLEASSPHWYACKEAWATRHNATQQRCYCYNVDVSDFSFSRGLPRRLASSAYLFERHDQRDAAPNTARLLVFPMDRHHVDALADYKRPYPLMEINLSLSRQPGAEDSTFQSDSSHHGRKLGLVIPKQDDYTYHHERSVWEVVYPHDVVLGYDKHHQAITAACVLTEFLLFNLEQEPGYEPASQRTVGACEKFDFKKVESKKGSHNVCLMTVYLPPGQVQFERVTKMNVYLWSVTFEYVSKSTAKYGFIPINPQSGVPSLEVELRISEVPPYPGSPYE